MKHFREIAICTLLATALVIWNAFDWAFLSQLGFGLIGLVLLGICFFAGSEIFESVGTMFLNRKEKLRRFRRILNTGRPRFHTWIVRQGSADLGTLSTPRIHDNHEVYKITPAIDDDETLMSSEYWHSNRNELILVNLETGRTIHYCGFRKPFWNNGDFWIDVGSISPGTKSQATYCERAYLAKRQKRKREAQHSRRDV